MRALSESFRARQMSHAAIVAVLAAGMTACSSDSNRFGSSFSNPFASNKPPAQSEVTGAVPARAPVGRVESQPLPQPQAVQTKSRMTDESAMRATASPRSAETWR